MARSPVRWTQRASMIANGDVALVEDALAFGFGQRA
jgi:hypothetical protein